MTKILDQSEMQAEIERLELTARSYRASLEAKGQKPATIPQRTGDLFADHEILSAFVVTLRSQCDKLKDEPAAPAKPGKLSMDQRIKAAVSARKDNSEAEKAILADFRTGKISMSDAVKRIKALK